MSETRDRGHEAGGSALSDSDRALLLIVQEGLPLVAEPYADIASRLGTAEEQVIETLRSLLERAVIKRLAAVPNHYALGVTANGMAVWDVPDERVSEIGRELGQRPEVTHCYRRPRAGGWPYSLFAMVHGTSREEVLSKIADISRELGLAQFPHDVLFSTRLLKKQGTRLRNKQATIAVEE